MSSAIYVSDSGNTKIMGSKKVDATYVTIKGSCPDSCPLKDEGCYAQTSFTGMTVSRLDKAADGLSTLQVARDEAKAINASYKGGTVPSGRDLRLHVSGDSRTLAGTRLLNNAVGRWKKRGGGDCWSYTHAWKNINRKEWNNVSILASVANVKEVPRSRKQGYAPAIVVATHISDKAYLLPNCDVKWIPCPAQTKNVSCVDCRLCFSADRLFKGNYGIAFEAHGSKKEKIKRRLTVIQ